MENLFIYTADINIIDTDINPSWNVSWPIDFKSAKFITMTVNTIE